MKTGRPEKIIDPKELIELMAFFPSLEETAGWFECSPDTISRFIMDRDQMTFAEFRNRYLSRTRVNLKRVAIKKALDGNDKILIHCLKSLTNLKEEIDFKDFSRLSSEELIAEAHLILSDLK